jgi:hypothetical protein
VTGPSCSVYVVLCLHHSCSVMRRYARRSRSCQNWRWIRSSFTGASFSMCILSSSASSLYLLYLDPWSRSCCNLLGALCSQLSALRSRLSAPSSQLSALSSQLLALSMSQLSAPSPQLFALSSQLSALSSVLSALSSQLLSCSAA